ncbi:MAG: hypothetical protein V1881_02610 [Candidatus Micrarchaeota archaeon]
MRRILAFVLVAAMFAVFSSAAEMPKNFVFGPGSQYGRLTFISFQGDKPVLPVPFGSKDYNDINRDNNQYLTFKTPIDMLVRYYSPADKKTYAAVLEGVTAIDFRGVNYNQIRYSPTDMAEELYNTIDARYVLETKSYTSSASLLTSVGGTFISDVKITVKTNKNQFFRPTENPSGKIPMSYYEYSVDSLKRLTVLSPPVYITMCNGDSCYFDNPAAKIELVRDIGTVDRISVEDVASISIPGGADVLKQLYLMTSSAGKSQIKGAIDLPTKFSATIRTNSEQPSLAAYYKTSIGVSQPSGGTQDPIKAIAKAESAPSKTMELSVTRFYYNGEPPQIIGDQYSSTLFFEPAEDISFVTDMGLRVLRDVSSIDFTDNDIAWAAHGELKNVVGKRRDTGTFSQKTTVTVHYGRAASSCVTPSVSPSVEIAMTVTSAGESVSINMENLPNKDASGKTVEVPLEVSFEYLPEPLTQEKWAGALAVMVAANAKMDPTKAKAAYVELYNNIGLRTANVKPTERIKAGVNTYFTPSLSPESRGPSRVDSEVAGQCKLVKRQSLLLSAKTKSSYVVLDMRWGDIRKFFGLPGPCLVRVKVGGELIAEKTIYLNSPDPTEAVAAAVAEVNKAAGAKLPSDTLLPVQYMAKGASTVISYGTIKSLQLTREGENYAIGGASLLPQKIPLGQVFTKAANMVALAEPVCYTNFAAPSCSCKGNDACTPVLVMPKAA